MIQIEDKLISFDVLDKKFVCDLSRCHGACCVQGDSGAPLEVGEMEILEQEFPHFAPFLRPEGIETVKKVGTSVIDNDGDRVTPLIDQKECAYVVFENGHACCGIEKAFLAGKTSFRKPVSCHLYPIRLQEYPSFTGLNYNRWEICRPALEHGLSLNVPLYIFLKDALIRKFGDSFYQELNQIAEEYQKRTESDSGMNDPIFP